MSVINNLCSRDIRPNLRIVVNRTKIKSIHLKNKKIKIK